MKWKAKFTFPEMFLNLLSNLSFLLSLDLLNDVTNICELERERVKLEEERVTQVLQNLHQVLIYRDLFNY